MANPLLNLGATSFDVDPYQIKVLRPMLEQAGLWNPAWNDWANYQAPAGDSSGPAEPAMPDFSSLAGMGAGFGDYGGGNRYEAVVGQDGQEVAGRPYFYDEPALFQGQELAQAAALIGGSALGMNALFGGLGGAAGGIPLTGAEMGYGSFPAGMEGFGFMPASGAGGATAGGGMTAGAGSLYAPAGFAGGAGSALAGAGGAAGAAGAAGGLGGLLSSLGSANSLANLGSAAIGLYGQNQAIGAMNDATNQSNEFNRYAFDTIRADNKPLVDMRNSVLPQIQGLLSNPSSIQQDPGYQFQFGEGQKALANSAAGRGMTYSGAQGKALQRYGQDYGATKLDQSLNRLTTVAGLGQVGSNSNNNATQNYANNQSGNALGMGQARGSVYGNMANIGGNALSNVFNNWQWDQVNGRGP